MSKDEGGAWALEKLPAPICDTIHQALDEYRNDGNESVLSKNQLVEFAEFMQKEIERAKTK